MGWKSWSRFRSDDADFGLRPATEPPPIIPSMSLDAPSQNLRRGAGLQFGVVAARFNEALVDGLLHRAQEALFAAGVRGQDVLVLRVPGSHEVPWAANELAASGAFHCVIALGVLIGGDTSHHEMVGQSVSQALQTVSIRTRVPVINGVIVTNTFAQAKARCVGKINRGAEFGHAALEMAALRRTLRGTKKS
ncbi:MAG: 6,7-dimethyl-8-ribityllumazine synthase [Opitutus sp.]|nr:6,7-dimethyl-8-ribityllumazine synthase [Opitutus sp.]